MSDPSQRLDPREPAASGTDPPASERQTWMTVFATVDLSALEAASGRYGRVPPYSFLRRPETGSILVQGRMGGTGEPFHLGEMTVTRCTIRLEATTSALAEDASLSAASSKDTRPDDTQPEDAQPHALVGTAYIAGRNHRHAELAAVLDAMMQNPAWHSRLQALVVKPLSEKLRAEQARRASAAASTKVDFFTMAREA